MKSISFTRYGEVGDLELTETEKPVPGENEVLVKIHATSVNDWDWQLLKGRPYINRLLFGLSKPKKKKVKTLGFDIAGTVEQVGKGVKKFVVGDEVFGDLSNKGWGGFAEYVCVDENSLAPKSKKMTFEQAAAIPQAGVLAVQGFMEEMEVKPGQEVLINGAGGGCGTLAIQIAKNFGANVTAVDKRNKFDMMLSLGADHLIDYAEEDFTKNGKGYDLILDFAGHHPLLHYKRALNDKGLYLLVGGASNVIIQCMFGGPIVSMFGSKKLKILVHKTNEYLQQLNELVEEGKLKIIIDSTYPLTEVPQALKRFGSGDGVGKVVVAIV